MKATCYIEIDLSISLDVGSHSDPRPATLSISMFQLAAYHKHVVSRILMYSTIEFLSRNKSVAVRDPVLLAIAVSTQLNHPIRRQEVEGFGSTHIRSKIARLGQEKVTWKREFGVRKKSRTHKTVPVNYTAQTLTQKSKSLPRITKTGLI